MAVFDDRQGASRTARSRAAPTRSSTSSPAASASARSTPPAQKYADQVNEGPGADRLRRDHRHPDTRWASSRDRHRCTPARPRAARASPSASARSSRTTRRLRPAARRGPRPARGERRGQVDADERPLRAPPARRGRDPARRRAGARSTRRGEAIDLRHRHGAPALHARPGHDGGREHRARRPSRARARCSTTRRRRARVRELSERFGLAVDPDAPVEDIGVGQQQRVEILRALYRGARGADPRRADRGADRAGDAGPVRGPARARRPRARRSSSSRTSSTRCSTIADRVTVLRRGKKIDTVPTEGATERSLARLMVGRDVLLRVDKDAAQAGRAAARGRATSQVARRPRPARRARALASRSARARSSALAGVDGNGQSELIEAITGPARADARARSASTGATSPAPARAARSRAGVGHIAEDRHRRGLVLDFDLAENLALREYTTPAMSQLRLALAASAWRDRARDAARGVRRARRRARDAAPASLSGGNQQKVVIAREIAERPAGADRRAADARARRRRDRVRPPPAGRASATRAAASCSSRSSSRRSARSSDRVLVIYEGQIVGRAAARRLRGGVRRRDDRRRARREGAA